MSSGRGLEVELFLDVGAVGLDCLDADVHLLGDLACAATLADKLEDLQFAVAEQVDNLPLAVGGLAATAPQQPTEDAAVDGLAHVDLPIEDAADGGQNLSGFLALHYVAARADAQDTLGVEEFVVHGEHQHG